MYTITAKIADIETTEGNYKNKLIAEKHKRRLGKKYPRTKFIIKRIAKEDKNDFKAYYAVEKSFRKEGGEK